MRDGLTPFSLTMLRAWGRAWRVSKRKQGPALNILNLDLDVALMVAKALQLGVLAAAVFAIGPGRELKHPMAIWFEFTLVLIAMLELSFVSWASHHVTLLVPAATFWAFALRNPHARERHLVAGVLFAWLLFLAMSAVSKSLSGLFLGTIVTFVVAAIVCRRMRLGLVTAPADGG